VDVKVSTDVANLVSRVAYARASEYAPLRSGQISLEVRDTLQASLLLSLDNVELGEGKNYTIVLNTSAAGLNAKVLADEQ
jgi:hypothetical protein